MIISHTHRFIFIHIPKTAGTAITDSLRPWLSGDCIVGDGSNFHPRLHHHAKASEVRRAFADLERDWDSYEKVTIIRNPYEVVHSDYWYHRFIGEKLFPTNPPSSYDPEYSWHLKCHQSQFLTFAEYTLRSYGHWDRGFYGNYCCDRDWGQLVTRIYDHRDIASAWSWLTERIGCSAPLMTVNTTEQVIGRKRPPPQTDWTPGLLNWAAHCFEHDFLRFGYTLGDAR